MSRILAVDGLRAVAVGVVFLTHAFDDMFIGGGIGVDVFFVISGLVITRSLLAEIERDGSFSFRGFYTRRFRRIVPPMIPVLVVCSVAVMLGAENPNWIDVAAALGSFMNWARAFDLTNGSILGHFWSLSIEEQFYLLWPACLAPLMKRGSPVKALIAVIVAVSLWRFTLQYNGAELSRLYNGLDTRADGLLLGCLLAFLPARIINPKTWPFAVAVFAVLVMIDWTNMATRLPVVAALSFWLVSLAVGPSTFYHRALSHPVAQWGGKRSYALYLWHLPVLHSLAHLGMRGYVFIPLAAVVTVLLAEASYRLIEYPLLRRGHSKTSNAARSSAAALGSEPAGIVIPPFHEPIVIRTNSWPGPSG